MNTILKQRLIGALILVALGVVFWPIIFVEPGGEAGQVSAPIPAPPGVDTTPIPAPDTSGIRTTGLAAAQREADAEAVAALGALDGNRKLSQYLYRSRSDPEPRRRQNRRSMQRVCQ